MGNMKIKKERESTGTDMAVRLLFLVIWSQNTVMTFAAQIFRKLPFIGGFYTYFTPTIILLLFLLLSGSRRGLS